MTPKMRRRARDKQLGLAETSIAKIQRALGKIGCYDEVAGVRRHYFADEDL